jgi:nicotinamidase-related amidase
MVTAADQLPGIVDRRHASLMVIDMQNCFCDESIPEVAAMMSQLEALIPTARAAGVPVIFTQVVQTEETDTEVWRSLYERTPWFRDLCRAGTQAADYHARFRPQPGDLALVKYRYSAFIGTPLEMWLRARDVKTVVLTGLTTDCCVGTTGYDAFQRDFHSVLVSDCTACGSPAAREAALAVHRDAFGIVASAADVAAIWSA